MNNNKSKSEKKIVAKVYFLAKKKKSEQQSLDLSQKKKYDEIRKISLPLNFQEFKNQIYLSILKDLNKSASSEEKDKLYDSDSIVMSILDEKRKLQQESIIFKFEKEGNWNNVTTNEEYQLFLQQEENLKIKVVYKQSLFKQKKNSKSKQSKSNNNDSLHLTVSFDFKEFQNKLQQNEPIVNNDGIFNFWKESNCIETRA
ncbi:hypothetical protein ABK040_009362 [Willaertia magna]